MYIQEDNRTENIHLFISSTTFSQNFYQTLHIILVWGQNNIEQSLSGEHIVCLLKLSE